MLLFVRKVIPACGSKACSLVSEHIHTPSLHKPDTIRPSTQQSVHNAVWCTHIEHIGHPETVDALSFEDHIAWNHPLKLLDHSTGHWTNQQETLDLDPWSAASGTKQNFPQIQPKN